MNIDEAGRILAHVKGETDNPLSRCINRALKSITLAAPREPASFVHLFKLRATPRRP